MVETYTVSSVDGPPLATGLTLAEAGRTVARYYGRADAMSDVEAETVARAEAIGVRRDDDDVAVWSDAAWRDFERAVAANLAEATP